MTSATVDDALSLLDEMNEQGRIEYTDYSQLHDAIAATLGRGTLTAEQVRKAVERHFGKVAVIDDGGEKVEWREGWVCNVAFNMQAIADELNATLRRGTCRNVHEPPKDGTFWPAPHFKCSECDATYVSMEYVFYCPNCGREVVDA
jgi:hypothetical protein